MITVTQASTSDLLVSVADIKEVLDITDSAYDAMIERLLSRATARIQNYCGKPLLVQRYDVRTPSYGSVNLSLPHRFIRTLFAVRDSSSTGQDALSSTGYSLDVNKGLLYRSEGWEWSAQFNANSIVSDPVVGAEYRRWYLDYSAGFIPAGGKDSGSTWDGTTDTGQTVPADLQEAAIGLVSRSWRSRLRDPDVASERVGELSITYRDTQSARGSLGIPEDIADLLRPYRSIA
jgi:hypothetical protein